MMSLVLIQRHYELVFDFSYSLVVEYYEVLWDVAKFLL